MTYFKIEDIQKIIEDTLKEWRKEKTDAQQVVSVEQRYEELVHLATKLLSSKKEIKDYKELKQLLLSLLK